MAIQKNTTNLLKKLGLPFSVIINETMNRIKDPATLGIYIYLQSKPESWNIQETDLMKRFGKGRDYIRARLKELRDCGLMVAKSKRNSDGKIVGWTTILYSHLEAEEGQESPPPKHKKNDKQSNRNVEEIKPKKNKELDQDTEKPEDGKTRSLENPIHINNIIKEKKEIITTTTVEVVVSETIDKELLELRDECMSTDEREPTEFIKQCKWHLDKGDTKKYNFSQRIAGLKKLIRQRRFETPADYPLRANKKSCVSDEVIMSNYTNYYNSLVEKDLRARGYQTKSFDEWRKSA